MDVALIRASFDRGRRGKTKSKDVGRRRRMAKKQSGGKWAQSASAAPGWQAPGTPAVRDSSALTIAFAGGENMVEAIRG